MDDFEQFLKNQPLRSVPPEWRAEILAVAAKASPRPRPASSIWRAWLWPSPYAWGALAAVWLAILALNVAAQRQLRRDLPPGSPLSDPEIIAALTGYQRELEELSTIPKAKPATPPSVKQPYSPGAWLDPRERDTDQLA